MIDTNNKLKTLSQALLRASKNMLEGNKTEETVQPIQEASEVPFKGSHERKEPKEDRFGNPVKDKNRARHLARLAMNKKMAKEEVEDLEELSQDKLTNYRAAAKKQGTGIQDKMKIGGGDWSKDGKDTKTLSKRLAGYKMAGRKINPGLAKIVNKDVRVPATEEVEIDESMSAYDRYTSTHGDLMKLHKSIGDLLNAHKKDAISHTSHKYDYAGRPTGEKHKGPNWGHVGEIDSIHSTLKDIHDRLAQQGEYKKMHEEVEELDEARGRPRKNPLPAGQQEEPEPRQHIMQQLQRAKLSMRGGEQVTFKDGTKHHISGAHAAKVLDKYAGMKPFEKEAFQKKIGSSHAAFREEV